MVEVDAIDDFGLCEKILDACVLSEACVDLDDSKAASPKTNLVDF